MKRAYIKHCTTYTSREAKKCPHNKREERERGTDRQTDRQRLKDRERLRDVVLSN